MATYNNTTKDYWISPNALHIELNALGNPDYIQASCMSGAKMLVYVKGIIDYDAGHNYRSWSLQAAPTVFTTHTEKYVYAAIPRVSDASSSGNALIVFPSELLDIYGANAEGTQIGSEEYYYIFLQGILTSSGDNGTIAREWKTGNIIDTGYLDSNAAYDAGLTDSEWYQYSTVSQLATFIKDLTMKAGTKFRELFAQTLNIVSGGKLTFTAGGEIEKVATFGDLSDNQSTHIVTPHYINEHDVALLASLDTHFLRKDQDDYTPHSLGVGGSLLVRGTTTLQSDLQAQAAEFAEDATMRGNLNAHKPIILDGNSDIRSAGNRVDSLQGSGFHLFKDPDDKWTGYLDNLYVRQALTTLELVYERVKVNSGTVWNAPGAGKVKSIVQVNPVNANIYLDLEDGEIGSFAAGDLCLGIYHFEDGNAEADSPDGLQVKGFKTVYFQVGSVYPSEAGKQDNGRLYITAKDIETFPCANMTIVAFGNVSNKSRQSSAYETRTFKRYLYNIDSYAKLGNVENIAMQLGDLSNLTIGEVEMKGYSAYLKNVYFSGILRQLKDEGLNVLNWKDDWASTETYTLNDEVYYDGQLFVYKSSTDGNGNPTTATDKWKPVSLKPTGEKGEDAVIFDVENDADQIPTDSNSVVVNTTTIQVRARVYKGGNEVTSGVQFTDKDGSTDGTDIMMSLRIPTANGGWVTPTVAYENITKSIIVVTWTIPAGTILSTDASKFDYSLGVKYNNVQYYHSISFAVIRGGIPGIAGAVVRPCGVWRSGVTYYNNASWIDVVLYNGTFFRLKDGVTSSTSRPTSSYWQEFNNFDSVATKVLLAQNGFINILGAQSLFVGETEGADGWTMTHGAITHAGTGMSLTSNGTLNIGKGKFTVKANQFAIENNEGIENVYVDEFGNLIVRGVINSLKTIIDDSNYDKKIIKGPFIASEDYKENPDYDDEQGKSYTVITPSDYTGLSDRCIDALCLSDVVVINSLPSGESHHLWLPHLTQAGEWHTGGVSNVKTYFAKTLTNNDGQKHLISEDELLQLVGKRLTIWNNNTNNSIKLHCGISFTRLEYGTQVMTSQGSSTTIYSLYHDMNYGNEIYHRNIQPTASGMNPEVEGIYLGNGEAITLEFKDVVAPISGNYGNFTYLRSLGWVVVSKSGGMFANIPKSQWDAMRT